MKYIKFLIFTYIAAIISLPISNFFRIDVQLLYRVPLLNIRFIDIAIIFIIIITFSSSILSIQKIKSNTTRLISIFIILFIIFQIFNFIRTYGVIELNAQFGFLSAYLSTIIMFYIINFLKKEDLIEIIVSQIRILIIAVIMLNLSLIFLFLTGRAQLTEDVMGQRVLFDVVGSKEVVGTLNLLFFAYLISLFKNEFLNSKKVNNIFSLLLILSTIIVSLLSFHRGTVFGLILCTIVYFLYISRYNFIRNLTFVIIISLIFFSITAFFDFFEKSGINPIINFSNTIEFALDTQNPAWDKGREFSRTLALQIWQSNFWFGMGFNYMDLVSKVYGVATPHHLIITSLMHNGLIGSILFLGIYSIIYLKAFNLFNKLRKGLIYQNERVFVIVLLTTSLLWLMVAFTQEVQLERYSSSFQYILFGIIIKLDDFYSTISNK